MTDPADSNMLAIRLLEPYEVDLAATILARSLLVEPGYIAIMPDEALRFRMLSTMFRGTLAQSVRHQAAWGAFDGKTLLGVAEWIPPLPRSLQLIDTVKMLPVYIRMLTINIRSTLGLLAEDRAAVRYFPNESVWYLMGLGVSASEQGRGIGSQLIQPGLDAATREGVAAYLETGTRQNVRFYTRFGFDIREPAAQLVKDGPTHWTMLRRPPQPSQAHDERDSIEQSCHQLAGRP